MAKSEDLTEKQEPATPPSTPPTYDSVAAAAKIEAFWDEKCPKQWWKYPNMILDLRPVIRQTLSARRIFRNRQEHPTWQAQLQVRVKNIPRLMQRGFHWSAANLVEGEDRIIFNRCGLNKVYRGAPMLWRHRRSYRFLDLDEKWDAVLFVYTISREAILNFDVESITMDNLFGQHAYDWHGHCVYYADKRHDSHFFNGISNNMPLGGWWLLPAGDYLRRSKPLVKHAESTETREEMDIDTITTQGGEALL